jgi:hypothetical protein
MKALKSWGACALAALLAISSIQSGFSANHREAPITALDRVADITDWFTFVSYTHPNRLVMILKSGPSLRDARR